MIDNSEWSVISCTVEEQNCEINIMELMKYRIDQCLNKIENQRGNGNIYIEYNIFSYQELVKYASSIRSFISRKFPFPSCLILHCDRVSRAKTSKKFMKQVTIPW